ncbi:MAG: NUDIX hydrolase [Gammaproteobacteria bacterium]|nr:NUDIX hydrolase [Gammaproteobacteria bacterium]
MHRADLLNRLRHYRTSFMEEAAMVDRTWQFVLQHENCFDRQLAHAHVTGSAWIINPSHTHALMLHHKKLNRWLQPGGHADGDPDILQVVLKETSEETGIALENITLVSDNIFDVDIHTVHQSVHDNRHEHHDIRFLLMIDDRLPIPGNSESNQVAWVPLAHVSRYNNARSLYRLVNKTRALQHSLAY